jgi:putative ABC transport system permease protein
MGIFQAYKMAIKSILSSKVRSFLTMLGVIIGVGAVMIGLAANESRRAAVGLGGLRI